MLFDCFLYHNEDAVLEVRLNELDPVVDVFVLVEATRTFSGKTKRINFDVTKQAFSTFAEKIRHIVVNDLPLPKTDQPDWTAEEFQRDCITRALWDVSDDDVIMLSDLDEIPRAGSIPLAIGVAEKNESCRLFLDSHYFYFNSVSLGDWPYGPILMKYKLFKERLPHLWKANTGVSEYIIPHAGWHFSYIGGQSAIREKLSSFSHREFDNQAGYDIWVNKANEAQTTALSNHYPRHILNNMDRFSRYLKERPTIGIKIKGD